MAEAAANGGHQQPEAEGGGGVRGMFMKFLRIYLVYMLVKTVFGGNFSAFSGGSSASAGGRQHQVSESNHHRREHHPGTPTVQNLWPPGTPYSIRLWLSSGPLNRLVWSQDGLVYAEDQPEAVLELEDIPEEFRERLFANASILARVVLSADQSEDLEPGVRGSSVVRSWPLTQHRKPPLRRARRQLLFSPTSEDQTNENESGTTKHGQGNTGAAVRGPSSVESTPTNAVVDGKAATALQDAQEEFQSRRVVHWKPELNIRLVTDWETYFGNANGGPAPEVRAYYQLVNSPEGGSRRSFEPPVHFDEFWLLRERFIEVSGPFRERNTKSQSTHLWDEYSV